MRDGLLQFLFSNPGERVLLTEFGCSQEITNQIEHTEARIRGSI
jgi:hypothetical protein